MNGGQVLRVGLTSPAAALTSTHRAAIAGLPALFRPLEDEQASRPDVALVDGTSPDWPERVEQALTDGMKGVVLGAPTQPDGHEVAELARNAESAGCPILVAAPFSYDATVHAWLSTSAAALEDLSVIESIVTVPETDVPRPARALQAGLVSQTSAVRKAVGRVSTLKVKDCGGAGYVASGTADGVPVLLAGVVQPAHPTLQFSFTGPRVRCTIRFDEATLSAPTQLTWCTSAGGHCLPRSYESWQRRLWRELHAAVTRGEEISHGLAELAQDLEAVGPRAGSRS